MVRKRRAEGEVMAVRRGGDLAAETGSVTWSSSSASLYSLACLYPSVLPL